MIIDNSYSPTGNLSGKDGQPYSYGNGIDAGVHAVTSVGSDRSFNYDANGNMKVQTEGAQVTEYLYDAENRLKMVRKNGVTVGQYTYDDEGQRTSKVVSGQMRVYVGDIYERKGDLTTDHIYAGGERVAVLRAGVLEYQHPDHLGGVNVITGTNGGVLDVVEYTPFGGFARHDGANAGQEGRFYTGQYRDEESGLYYYNARYYSPKVGRFLTADWIVPDPFNPQDLNRYSYVGNNPINYIDPTGNALCGAHGCVEVQIDGLPNYDNNLVAPRMSVTQGMHTFDTIQRLISSPPSMLGSMVPVLGPIREAAYNFSTGHPVWGTINAAFAVADVVSLGVAGTAIRQLGKAGVRSLGRAMGDDFVRMLGNEVGSLGGRSAYQIALSGGKHAGFLRRYSRESIVNLQKGIKSLKNEIVTHQAKILNPEKYIEGWSKLDPRQQLHLVTEKWPKDIQRQREQLNILENLLKGK